MYLSFIYLINYLMYLFILNINRQMNISFIPNFHIAENLSVKNK